MKKVRICYTCFKEELSSSVLEEYMVLLPEDQRERNARYRRWQDRQAHLFGRLLLLEGWKHFDVRNPLAWVQYDIRMRPFIPGNIDFNISHAGNYVICVIGEGVKLGVDIELCHDIGLSDYQSIMSEQQWADIYGSESPYRSFFRYWAMKEAVIKADGRGLSIPLANISFNGQGDAIQAGHWFMRELHIDAEYQAWLACNTMEIELLTTNFIFDTVKK